MHFTAQSGLNAYSKACYLKLSASGSVYQKQKAPNWIWIIPAEGSLRVLLDCGRCWASRFILFIGFGNPTLSDWSFSWSAAPSFSGFSCSLIKRTRVLFLLTYKNWNCSWNELVKSTGKLVIWTPWLKRYLQATTKAVTDTASFKYERLFIFLYRALASSVLFVHS